MSRTSLLHWESFNSALHEWCNLEPDISNELEQLFSGATEETFHTEQELESIKAIVFFQDMELRYKNSEVELLRRRRDLLPNGVVPDTWSYRQRQGQWYHFDTCSSALLTHSFRLKTKVQCIHTLHGGSYKVNFEHMLQKNIQTGYCRPIRRQLAISDGSATSRCATEYIDPSVVASVINNGLLETGKASNDICSICLDPFSNQGQSNAIRLERCIGHYFHRECIREALERRGKCPNCNEQYYQQIGNQPKNGTMHIKTYPSHSCLKIISGYENDGTIEITYTFPDGIQDYNHPNPGKTYRGTFRRAYLPNNVEGRQVLEMLQRCFKQRLTFTIGNSLTTGQNDVIIWNGIHHKTNLIGGIDNYGYPDATYLTRVKEELKLKGITVGNNPYPDHDEEEEQNSDYENERDDDDANLNEDESNEEDEEEEDEDNEENEHPDESDGA